MKKMTYFVMALALVLGLAQCKKEQIEPQNEGNSVMITLDVDGGNNNGSRAEVVPPHVNFKEHDTILVVSDRKYVGYLVHNGTNFSGGITNPTVGKPLYFYFLGNKVQVSTLTPGTTDECTVNISDQTDMNNMPVISMGKSTVNYSSGTDSYSSRLYNKASLMKFNVTTDSDAAICITGMNNEVTVDFSDPTDSGFTYDMNTTDGGLIKMASGAGSPAVKWAIVLPQPALTETGEAYSEDQSYIGTRPTIHAIESNKYYHEGGDVINMTVNTHVWNGNLAALTGSEPVGFATARNGMTVYGTLSAKVKVSIDDGATVTLNNATISYSSNGANYAGLTLIGDGTLVLADGTTNTVFGGLAGNGDSNWPGIYVPEGKTLTINGNTGVLNAAPGVIDDYGSPAGIGCGWDTNCGDIVINGGVINANGGAKSAGIGGCFRRICGDITINGGTITATAGYRAAGIGTGGNRTLSTTTISPAAVCGNITINGGDVTAIGGQYGAGIGNGGADGASNSNPVSGTCGNILITGGTVTATGGQYAAAIGNGYTPTTYSTNTCGTITITDGVTLVTATHGSGATYSIGSGLNPSDGSNTCGTITIGGTNYGTSGVTPNRPDGKTFVYPLPEGVINGLFSVSSTKQVYFSKGSLQYIGSASTPYWKFADNQWDLLSITNQNTNNTNVDRDIFSWGTSGYAHGASIYQPWGHGTNNNQFYAYGDQANYLSASTGTADWGYNAISNGGNQEHLWYTLNKDEWTYLFSSDRPGSTVNGTDKAHYARATVEGINGVILFPDIYTHPTDVNQPNYINSNSGEWANTYTAADFMKMEAHGAVFLPACGGYVGGNIVNRNVAAFYWSSQPDNNGNALGLYLNNNSINCANSMYRHLGIGVRLVRNAE